MASRNPYARSYSKYYRDGVPTRESSESRKRGDAVRLLRLREGDVGARHARHPKVGRLRFNPTRGD